MAAGADMRRIHFVTGAVDADGKARSFDPSTDIQALQRAAAGKNITLMIVDPIVSAVAGDSHKNTEVRRALQPLVDFAAQAKCSILGITHYSKGSQGADPTDRVIGSVAFGAVARVVFACVKQGNSDDGSDPHSRLFVRSKSNIGPDGGGFRYTLEQVEVKGYPGLWASRILWGEELEGNAREILSKAEAVEMDNKGNSDIEECKQFLLDTLSGGAVCAKLIREEADQAGHSWKLVDRVSRELGIIKKKEGFKSGWTWDMPPKNPKNPEYPDKKNEDCSDSSGDDSALIATKSATGIFEVTL
jgi:putative DNA primase/helicase